MDYLTMTSEDMTLRLLSLLGSFRPVVIPPHGDVCELKRTLRTISKNASATARFCSLLIGELDDGHELYLSLCEAQLAARNLKTKMAKIVLLKCSKKCLDKLREQYDNFSASVTHCVVLIDPSLVGKVYL